ncbi:fumarate hydratase class II [Natronobacillus azotifigens]|uniref:Fumarate hydratase class II n=1 Tax=Natronobacillus azotifigens TaxID=472978 RepID=A0A9J6R929_9BACI|nr:class II fumarate hydratase [Natronobacillus azotifigens]MCZ0702055.1 class II fumarate hydratase [Natronobacillus azotifigens]
MDFRFEKDTLGEVKVDARKFWGAQTQRSIENFPIGQEIMPLEIIRAFVQLKRSAAIANGNLGGLEKEKVEAIVAAADQLLNNDLSEHFPLVVWQTGSGTQTNMNVNEVLAYLGNQYLATKKCSLMLHPNDDINKSQSSNDTYPTAMHVAAVTIIEDRLLPVLQQTESVLANKVVEFQNLIKIGRTHLQDATPLTLGQEISGWHHMIEKIRSMLANDLVYLSELAIGGTAVGTGINADSSFGDKVATEISRLTGKKFISASNKFHALTSHDQMVHVHGTLKALAADVMKIANDVRWLASGPRAGFAELTIPANEPGSSIMPGKINPTQAEAVTMVATQVMGNDATIGFAASQGNFELNVFKPVIAYNFIQSVTLLADSLESFTLRCLEGLQPNEEKIADYVNNSLMLVTALNPHIGYENAAKIAKKAFVEKTSLKEAAVGLALLTAEEFDQLVDPTKMIGK